MSLEEQIQTYKALVRQIAEMDQQRRALGAAILEQMSTKMLSVGGYVVRRYDRLSIKTSLAEARQLEATKMEEVLDKDKLQELHFSGHEIPGVSTASFIQVSVQKQETGPENSDSSETV